jgi:hypothetical protein
MRRLWIRAQCVQRSGHDQRGTALLRGSIFVARKRSIGERDHTVRPERKRQKI